jgi:hypothetical protein
VIERALLDDIGEFADFFWAAHATEHVDLEVGHLVLCSGLFCSFLFFSGLWRLDLRERLIDR